MSNSETGTGVEARVGSLEIDGSFDQERYLIKWNGVEVLLTGKSFKYLTKLAHRKKHGRSGWIYKEDIEPGFNQAKYIYRMNNELRNILGDDVPALKSNKLGYYQLGVDSDQISFNEENLKKYPDWEIRNLFS